MNGTVIQARWHWTGALCFFLGSVGGAARELARPDLLPALLRLALYLLALVAFLDLVFGTGDTGYLLGMATFAVDDRVYETSVTTGTGAYTLAGAVTGFQTFSSAIGADNQCWYFAVDEASGSWEVGIGTVLTGPDRLQRDTILDSSNTGSAVNWGSGTRQIKCGLPADFAMPRVKSKSVAGSANVTLTQDEMRCDVLILTGALTGNIEVRVDATPWTWHSVYNNTTGAFTVTFLVTGQTGVLLPQALRTSLHCDGTDVRSSIAALTQSFALSGANTPAQITASQNNYSVPDNAVTLRLDGNASGHAITGMTGNSAGRMVVLENIGANMITLTRESASSAAANRFASGANVAIGNNEAVVTLYDPTSSRHRVITQPPDGEYRSVQVFTGNGTWTKPAGLKRVRVTVKGGGGASAGAGATDGAKFSAGTGGGEGGTSIKTIAAASLGATETVTIGAGGTGTATSGNNGGTSSFGTHATATGGTGGNYIAPAAVASSGGADGGVGASGDINIKGAAGGGVVWSTTSSIILAGNGGNGPPGFGGGTGTGVAGDKYGQGGSGPANNLSASAQNGFAGGAGVVIVEEFF